jgi:hypothetical protein
MPALASQAVFARFAREREGSLRGLAMLDRQGEILPPGWGAVTLLPPPRRRRRWLHLLLPAAFAAAGAIAVYLH